MIATLLLRIEPDLSLDSADDLTREVFLTLLEDAGKRGRRRGPIHDQLRGIVIDETRAWRVRSWFPSRLAERLTIRTPTEQDGGDASPPPPPDSVTRLTEVVSGLSRPRRDLLILSVVEGMSVKAMSQALRRSKGSIRRSLRAARFALWKTRSTAQIPPPITKECRAWSTFIDGDLAGSEAAGFQSHSRDCDHCGPATLEWWRLHAEIKAAADDRVARRPSASQSREVAAMLLGRAYERRRHRIRRRVVLVLALSALTGLCGAWFMGWLG